jgi:hypothetical protein
LAISPLDECGFPAVVNDAFHRFRLVTNSVKNEGAKNRVVTLLIPCCGDTVRYRRGTLPQLRRFENHRRPFDTLRTGTEDPLVIVKFLSHLGLPTRAPLRAPARRVDLVQTI